MSDTYYNVHLAHGILMTLLWGFCADFLMLSVRYFRNHPNYLKLHKPLAIINYITIAIALMVLIYDGPYVFNSAGFAALSITKKAHFIFGVIFIFSIIGIQLMGTHVKNLMKKGNNPDTMVERKSLHRDFGYGFYFLSKIQILIGWYNLDVGLTPIIVILIWYGLFFGFKFGYLERNRYFQNESIYINFKTQNNERFLQKRNALVELVNDGVTKQQIKSQYPDIKYVFFKNMICDMSELIHPGGKHLIEEVVGEQISRYINGSYGLQSIRNLAYKHSIYTQKYLRQYQIGKVIQKAPILISQTQRNPETVFWNLKSKESMTKHTKCFHFTTENYRVNCHPQNIAYLGKHFQLSQDNSKLAPRLYTVALCMSPYKKKIVEQILSYLNGQKAIKPEQIQNNKKIDELTFVIKQYKVKGFSEFIHKVENNQKIRIQGPFGRGLQITTGTFYAFCGGTGVLPLLDLIFEILLQIYLKAVDPQHKSRLPPKFKLVMFLSVNDAQQWQGLKFIGNTYLMDSKYKSNIFDLRLRISKAQYEPSGIKMYKERINRQLLKKVLVDDIKKVFVCGSPEMNKQMYENLLQVVPKQTIHII